MGANKDCCVGCGRRKGGARTGQQQVPCPVPEGVIRVPKRIAVLLAVGGRRWRTRWAAAGPLPSA